MLKIKIESNEFIMPSEWAEVSLKNYIDIVSTSEDKNNSELDIFIKTLALLCEDKMFIKCANEMNIEDFKQIQEAFKWIQLDPPAPKSKQKHFLIGKEKWTIKEDFNKLTVGESISVEIMLKDKKLDLSPLEIAFGVLFRRVKDDGTVEAFNPDNINLIINEHSKVIKVTDVYNVITFFLNKEKRPLEISKVSLTQVANQKTNTPSKAKKMKTK